jgi:hypothetical protein
MKTESGGRIRKVQVPNLNRHEALFENLELGILELELSL